MQVHSNPRMSFFIGIVIFYSNGKICCPCDDNLFQQDWICRKCELISLSKFIYIFPTQVLFRAVAMMVPDYALIGEISLYSMGFVQAKSYVCCLYSRFTVSWTSHQSGLNFPSLSMFCHQIHINWGQGFKLQNKFYFTRRICSAKGHLSVTYDSRDRNSPV